jgi:hypothetical protein
MFLSSRGSEAFIDRFDLLAQPCVLSISFASNVPGHIGGDFPDIEWNAPLE